MLLGEQATTLQAGRSYVHYAHRGASLSCSASRPAGKESTGAQGSEPIQYHRP